MKKFIAATVTTATLLLAPVAVLAADTISEIKALAEKDGLKVTETSTQIIIMKPKTTPTTPSTPSTPAPQPPVTKPTEDTTNDDFRFSPEIELKTTKNITSSTLVLHAVYSQQINGRNTFDITKEAKLEVTKNAPFTLDKSYKIIPTKKGTGIIIATYKGKKAEITVEIRAFNKTKDGISCYAVLKDLKNVSN